MPIIEVEKDVGIFAEDINPNGKQPIVFIHGWPLEHSTFEYQYNVFPMYGFRCVGIDLRGFGKSSKPWQGYTYDRLAEDIRIVIETMNLKNVILAGHSMGGAISMRYMARFNGAHISKLALLAAAAPSFVQREGYPFGMTKAQVNDLVMNIYTNRPQAIADFGQMFFAKPVTPAFRDWFQSTGLSASAFATIKTAQSLRDEDLRNDVPKIHTPTGIFWGLQDRICPYPFALELHKGIRDSVLNRFDYSGHAVYYDELEHFNTVFLDFAVD